MADLGAVGLFLENEALRRGPSNDGGLFGRSAYNRYYYAAFLTTRELVKEIDPGLTGLVHKSYPEYLRVTVRRRIKKQLLIAKRLSDSPAISTLSVAIDAIKQLSELLSKGYALRVAADYSPEISIGFTEAPSFNLNGCEIKEARQWPARAAQWANHISSAWKQVNV